MTPSDVKATLSFSDGSPNMDLPIYKGSIGPDVIDIRKLYGQTGKFTYDPGFLSTASCNSTITYIDGDKGELLYRGYPIEQLATNCDFLETCYLLLNGELPTAEEKAKFVSTGSIVAVRALPGFEAEVRATMLKAHPHLTCWDKDKIPARYDYGTNPRVPPIVCLADSGWYFVTDAALKKRLKEQPRDGGAHGYDPASPDMRAVFVAHGPAFKPGVVLPVFDNVDVYPLLVRLIGVKGEKGDARLGPVKAALR